MTLYTPYTTTKMMKDIRITVIDYPSASKSAIYGFAETLAVANEICKDLNAQVTMNVEICKLEQLDNTQQTEVVVLPPSISDTFYTKANQPLNNYLLSMQKKGATLASACVGSFILARAGLLDNKLCTTHWRLTQEFSQTFPKVRLNTNAIIINEGNIITAGGRMAWLDLAVEIISSYCSPTVLSTLSKEMVIDIGHREQKFYRQFIAKTDHGDELILKLQAHFDMHYAEQTPITSLAEKLYVTTRTLQRRFNKACGMSIIEYLQKLRLHKACQEIEFTQRSITEIAFSVGYQNVNAFRKVFVREYGLTPGEYRKRFTT